ncbi:DNA segregation ATPase FtsK/SpoIIIE, S-DNA-T family [Cohnella sp. OV330]|uniref:DNA translocase FtsK n=1 Tax=Cohnella sp. OV330 TaxID=1855288 RepID=UPI0008E1028E|nr:DNA translocase FtsK [Cohnella sp. OV330]SFB43167.1 DNA segregation ATPase FtsK/SpoIIIE, S-DNA-T family [Cohnella sp. OV330]
MAKRKRKKETLGASLKYEIYGILLITISVIAMYGEAAGGRSLSKLFGYLLGKFYFLLPIAGIWLGLHVMIRRAWPRGWTIRRSGFVMVCCGLTLLSSMSFVDSRLGPLEAIRPSAIFSQTTHQLYEQLWNAPIENEARITGKDIGGGLLGAMQYSIFYWLFGYYGAKFVLIVEFVIAFMLLTNRSYVDMMKGIRTFGKRLLPLLAQRLSGGRKLANAKAVPVKSKPKKGQVAAAMATIGDDDFQEEPVTRSADAKKPYFFQLFHGKPVGPESAEPDDMDGEPALYPSSPAVNIGARPEGRGKSKKKETEPAFVPVEEPVVQAPYIEPEDAWQPASAQPDPGPRFHDFADQVPSFEEADEAAWTQSELELDDPAGADAQHVAGEAPDMPDGEAVPAQAAAPGAAGAAADDASATAAPAPVKPKRVYRMPPIHLLGKPQGGGKGGAGDGGREVARKLEATLESFGVRAKVLDVARGPAVTRYELQPDVGVKVSRIVSLTDDIALALAAKDIRMEAPIPGKSAIGIEVPNNEVSVVTLREVLETPTFQEAQSKLTIAFGRDISGQPIVGNLARMPHMLVAGATGSGKSVCINGIITSLLYKAKPDEVKFLMIDPKMVELNVYNGIPHLLAPVVTDPRRASLALKKIVVEMEKRYEKFSKSGTRNIEGYNNLMLSGDNPDGVLPYIVVIVDELADLMMVAAGDVEDAICRLAQMARAAGIHLIIATQRPSVDVITGVIKANIPSRIAFGVSSQVDSRTILDMVGAEKLLGRGDMLFLPMGASKPIRVQGAFLSDNEVESVVAYSRGQAEAEYNEELVPEIEESDDAAVNEQLDELFDQAVGIVLEAKQASVSLLQRRMRIGYTRAARLIDSMEARGVVGPYEGSKPREVLVTLEQFQQRSS